MIELTCQEECEVTFNTAWNERTRQGHQAVTKGLGFTSESQTYKRFLAHLETRTVVSCFITVAQS